uniref:Uncharacterized protein n=1 Tax=Cacopsylla melanoneura TaxID=428564 RepID=A0A8D9ECS5_9HEMI
MFPKEESLRSNGIIQIGNIRIVEDGIMIVLTFADLISLSTRLFSIISVSLLFLTPSPSLLSSFFFLQSRILYISKLLLKHSNIKHLAKTIRLLFLFLFPKSDIRFSC